MKFHPIKALKALWSVLKGYLYELKQNRRYMNNWQRSSPDYWSLSSELIFYYHKLEKGLSMPGESRFFGAAPARQTCKLLDEWVSSGFSQNDSVFLGAVESLRGYFKRMPEPVPEELRGLNVAIKGYLENIEPCDELSTPIPKLFTQENQLTFIEELATRRRSVRNFIKKPVELEFIERAVSVAQKAPSACNRQPCKLHLYSNGELQQKLLKYQNGNRGFGQDIPLLGILTSDSRSFFDHTEKNEPYLDAGLFLMGFIYALEAQGISSCCLNWCVSPWEDQQVRKLTTIAPSEKIITYLAIGYAADDCVVPRSPRRSVESILNYHG
ncbi:nitroreductase [Alteromonadaceae bacterium 2753L.S.0a.02]|nr:nitroreductase [Alteromonadaceae bacterium 2753L.S.0a.02]